MSEDQQQPQPKKRGPYRNQLKRDERFRLDTWVNAHRDEITNGEYTAAAIADLLREEVCPTLTADNVHGSVEAFGIKFKPRKPTASKHRNQVRRAVIRQVIEIVHAMQAEGFKLELDPILKGLDKRSE